MGRRRAADAPVVLVPLDPGAAAPLYRQRPARGALLLGYAAFDGREIRDGVRRLKRALSVAS